VTQPDTATALALLADRWDQMAKATAHLGDNLYIDEPTPIQREQIARAATYRRAAADLRETVATGRIPHGLMTDAELEQHSNTPDATPA
jgi:hypothetical protein